MNLNVDQKTLIIGISGGSGSGKTTFASLVADHYGDKAALISLDSYYKDLSAVAEGERKKTNFDHPDSIDFTLFKKDIESLKNKKAINVPIYSFESHTRSIDTIKISHCPIIILEGIYSFFDKDIYDLVDYTIYIDASSDIRLIRRIRRDMNERGRDVDSVIKQYEDTVRKMHIKYISTQKQKANLVVENNGETELSKITEFLIQKINEL